MSPDEAKQVLDKIIGQLFGFQNPFSLEQFMKKYAFDVRLPQAVKDSFTGEETWAQSINPTKFVTKKNSMKGITKNGDWEIGKKPLKDLTDILAAWNYINYMSTERSIESINVSQSDNIYNSENVFRSQDSHFAKNILFCDGVHKAEYVAASQRSVNTSYSIRVEDSKDVDQSFAVIWSGKITKSLFINDCYDMYECMFCSHMNTKQFCIANMQYTEEEYKALKPLVIKWILTN